MLLLVGPGDKPATPRPGLPGGPATATSLAAKYVEVFRSGYELVIFHGHAFTDEDWSALLDFADKHLRGLPVERRFDRFPTFAEALFCSCGMRFVA